MANENILTETAAENTTVVPVRERLKSWALWVSVLGVVGLVLQALGVFEKIGLDSDEWDGIITAVGALLSAFGIVNNPTDRGHF